MFSRSRKKLRLRPPGWLRRRLALRFCEVLGRPAELISLSRDTSESDLKQVLVLRTSSIDLSEERNRESDCEICRSMCSKVRFTRKSPYY